MNQLRESLRRKFSQPVKQEFDASLLPHTNTLLDSSRMKLSEPDARFFELFASGAGLAQAVKEGGCAVLQPADIHADGRVDVPVDLANKEVFRTLKKFIKERKIRWLHMATPRRTFTKVRRRNRFAKLRQLRTQAKPEGLEPKCRLVKEANLLASRSAQLAHLQWKTRGIFSTEHPESSYLWNYKPIKFLFQLRNVKLYKGDQCCFMSEFVKPTGWLSNGSFFALLEERCPQNGWHRHTPLEGFTTDFHGLVVFKTSLADEYPQGLCDELAKAYVSFLKDHPARAPTWRLNLREGEPQEIPWSKKFDHEQANEACVGGLRNPASSVYKVPGWLKVGPLVAKVLGLHLKQQPSLSVLHEQVGQDCQIANI